MIIIASYDISDDKRRINAMNTLKALGFIRVQRSLYITRGELNLAKDAVRALSKVIKTSEDSVIIVIIDNRTWASGFRLGNLNDQVEGSVMVI